MYTTDFADLYRNAPDEQLMQLACASGELTPDALFALNAELSVRKLSVAQVTIAAPEPRITGPKPFRSQISFLAEVHRVYHAQFWLFAMLAAPAVLVGTSAITFMDGKVHEVMGNLRGVPGMFAHRAEILAALLVKVSGFATSWVAASISFAAICIAIDQLRRGKIPSVSHCYSALRDRWISLLGLSLFFYVLGILAFGVGMLLMIVVIIYAPSLVNPEFSSLLIFVVAMLPLTRFGLAIPAILFSESGIRQAMFQSYELTAKSWFTLSILLIEAIYGGYLASMLPFFLVGWFPGSVDLLRHSPLLLTLASIACVSVVESPMFIGFALMYLRRSENEMTSAGFLAASPTVP